MPKSNTINKIISVVIAMLLWAYVIGTVDPMKTTTIPDVPVQLLNQDSLTAKGLALSGEVNYTVDIVVEGKRADLAKLTAGDFTAQADLYGYSMGKNYIPITTSAPDSATVIGVSPNKIVVSVEELVSASKPIKVIFAGQLDEDMEAGGIVTQPEVIEVTGAKSEVDAVSYIQAQINASRLTTEGATIQTKAIAVNREGDVVANVRLSSDYIDVTARLFNVKEVPLNAEIIGQVEPIYEVTNIEIPSSVKIRGAKSALAGINELIAEPIDISQVSNTGELPIKVLLPQGVEFAAGYENLSVVITIKPVATKQFTYESSEIKVEGMDDASNISITTPQISVLASGSEAVIRGLQRDDLEIYISLDAASLLSATAKVMIRHDKQLGYIMVDPEEVHITLNQTETQ